MVNGPEPVGCQDQARLEHVEIFCYKHSPVLIGYKYYGIENKDLENE